MGWQRGIEDGCPEKTTLKLVSWVFTAQERHGGMSCFRAGAATTEEAWVQHSQLEVLI